MRPPRGDEARPLDRTSHTLFEDPSSLMRRDLSLGMPIPSRQLRGIGIPRDIAAAEAQGLRMKWKTESSRSCFSRRFMEARRFSSSEEVGVA